MPKTLYSARQKRLIEVLVRERERAGLTQTEVAKALKRHQPFVSGIESGHRRVDVVELMDLAEIFGVDVLDIIRELKKISGVTVSKRARA